MTAPLDTSIPRRQGYLTRLEALEQEVRYLKDSVENLTTAASQLDKLIRLLRQEIITHILKGPVPVHPEGPNAAPFPQMESDV